MFTRALLRGMLRYEARLLPLDHAAQIWIARALAIAPDHRRVLTWGEQGKARNLLQQLGAAYPDLRIRYWPEMCRAAGNRQILLVAAVVAALYAPHYLQFGYFHPYPRQAPYKGHFRTALLLFAAERSAQGWTFSYRNAARWRWIAGFEPGQDQGQTARF